MAVVQGLHPNFSHISLLKNTNPAMNTIIAKKRVKRIVNILGFNNSFIKSYYTISGKESVPPVLLESVTPFTPWHYSLFSNSQTANNLKNYLGSRRKMRRAFKALAILLIRESEGLP